MGGATTHAGSLPRGSRWRLDGPSAWNGVLAVLARPIPVGEDEPAWEDSEPLVARLVGSGYAVAGHANTIFWPLERCFSDFPALLEVATGVLGPPRHTVALGPSIGGIMTAGLVQRFPDRLSGALAMCGNLAGAVAIHNRELDIAFVVRTLLAAGSALQVVRITDPHANLRLANTVLKGGQENAAGRARLALAAAVGNIPGWHDPTSAEPAATDFDARLANQLAWFRGVGFLVYFWAREQVERQAGGNPSWNTGVDYRRLLASSINRDQVEALYRVPGAGVDLDDDLERLAAEPRIEPDPSALAYLERHIVFDGDLGGVPVVTLHSDGDGLVTPDNERAYADVVRSVGQGELLRQVWVHRAGHCTFTLAEIQTALEVLMERVEAGSWPALDPGRLNDVATGMGGGANVLVSGEAVCAGFFDFDPRPFPRPYDARHAISTAT